MLSYSDDIDVAWARGHWCHLGLSTVGNMSKSGFEMTQVVFSVCFIAAGHVYFFS